jgi:hypothetical protein
MSEADIAANQWCLLNVFEWPEDLPFPKPEGFDAMSHREKMENPQTGRAWNYVCERTTMNDRLRAWNTRFKQPRWSEEKFEQWWASTFPV